MTSKRLSAIALLGALGLLVAGPALAQEQPPAQGDTTVVNNPPPNEGDTTIVNNPPPNEGGDTTVVNEGPTVLGISGIGLWVLFIGVVLVLVLVALVAAGGHHHY